MQQVKSLTTLCGGLFLICVVAILAISLPLLGDPMVRHDDYPALFAQPEGFWEKTLHEGRWLNYIWHLRGFETPAWLNYALYQALWATFAAALASVAAGSTQVSKFSVSLAFFILISPSALLISLWFNTLLPGLALVALFAVLACKLSERTMLWLLPVFVALTFMAYTTYPLLLLAVCLCHQKRRSLGRLFMLLALFTASFIAAVLLTYTINWFVHGVFGVPLDDWRKATPAADWNGILANVDKLWETLGKFAITSSFNFPAAVYFHLCVFLIALFTLFRFAPLEGLYLLAGLVTGLTLVVAQVLKLGVEVPVRSFIFVWVFYALILMRAAALLSQTHALASRTIYNAAFLVIASYALQSYKQAGVYTDWQTETRQLAQTLAATAKPIRFTGHPKSTAAAQRAGIQVDDGFQERIYQLTGQRAQVFEGTADELDLSNSLIDPNRRAKPFALAVVELEDAVIAVFD